MSEVGDSELKMYRNHQEDNAPANNSRTLTRRPAVPSRNLVVEFATFRRSAIARFAIADVPQNDPLSFQLDLATTPS